MNSTIPSKPTPQIGRTAGKGLFVIAAWVWGLLCVLGGLTNMSKHPLMAIGMLLLGLLVLPPIWKLLVARIGRPLPMTFTLVPGTLALIIMAVLAGDLAKEQKVEAVRLAAIQVEKDKATDSFIAQHPHVQRTDYQEWVDRAKDSTKDPKLTIQSFLSQQDSTYAQRIKDSVNMAQTRVKDSTDRARKAYQAKLESDRAAKREAARIAAANKPETYNGHVIQTGPRGGRYYINSNGNKTYIH